MLILLTVNFLVGCGSKNLYMKRGTNEYNRVTYNLLGDWNVSSYTLKGSEKIGSPFMVGKVFFEDIEEGKAYGNVRFFFTLDDSVLKERAKEWAQRWPEVKIERYDVVVQARWLLHSNGDVIYFQDPLVGAEITGSGKNFPAVVSWENGKLQTTSIASSGESRRGIMAGQILKASTGISAIYPEVPPQARFQLVGKTLKTSSAQRIDFSLDR